MLKYLLYFLLVILITSCNILNSNEMFRTANDFKYSEFTPSEKEYRIKSFDKLDIHVYTNDGIRLIDTRGENPVVATSTITYLVEYDGMVKLPSLGRVEVAGLSLREAEQLLEEKYKLYYNNPFVMMNVTNRRVFVFAEGGNRASVIQMTEENFTLIEALAQSGGISDFSKAFRIKLIRGDLNNPEVFLFNVSDLKDMQKANFLLQANDIIYVEARPRYASKILVEIAPYLSLFSTAILIYGIFK
jgi:polysaccharide biosynthesis/export protein